MIAKKFELNTFLDLLKNQEVEAFLQRDRCFVSIDNFLLAAAFVFFKRANLTLEEFTVRNLWLALFLAHDAEEDEEPRKWEMLPWALGADWQHHLKSWEVEKQAFWRRINYRVLVSKEQCKQVMALAPNHEALSRCRPLGHGGARRMRKESFVPSGPQLPTPKCSQCLAAQNVGAQWRGWRSQVGGRSISSLHRVTEAVMPFSSMNNLRKPKRREKQPGKDGKIRLLRKVTTLSYTSSSIDTKLRFR